MFDVIREDITTNDVVLYMKGVPAFPQCGFSARAVAALNQLGVAFKGVNVLDDPSLREAIKQFSNWPTLPQLYIKGDFIGGTDILNDMVQSDELQELLQKKGIPFQN